MTMTIVVLALLGLAGSGGGLLAWRLKKDLDRQRANIRALESMTAHLTYADRLRAEKAREEERSLVRKLLAALDEEPVSARVKGSAKRR